MNEVKSPKKPLLYYYFVAMLLVMLFNFIAMPWLAEHQIKEVDYNTFVTMTEQGEVGRVEIQEQSNRILFTSSDEKTVYKTAMVPDDGLVQRLLDAGVSTTGEEIEQTSTLVSILAWVLPIIIFVALGQYMSRKMMEKMGGGGNSMMFNMGKSNAKVYVKSAEGIKFDDVAGEDEAKENLTEVVNYLHDPSKYQEIGASMPKGILLVGPPGTGKTMLAKAVAGEANVPFFSMSGSEFVEMFVGMGASKVRDLFKQAKEKAPCIVFIDEIDAIGQKRSGGQYGGNDEREQTLNQLLTEMDGFEGNNGVIILAATNRPDQQHHITMTCVADGHLLDFLETGEICTIVGTALDNATESVETEPDHEKRLIRVAVYAQNGFVMLRFENYCAQEVELGADGLPRRNTHGGSDLRSVRAAAEKRGGTMTLHWENEWFTLRVLLPQKS